MTRKGTTHEPRSAFRLTKTKYIASLDGEDARLYGGRWNSRGTRMLYLAGSLSAVVLETLVHIDRREILKGKFSYRKVLLPASATFEAVESSSLPNDWNADVISEETQRLGDRWVKEGRTVVLQVPSVIIEGEYHYLINPDHPDHALIDFGEPKEFHYDPRLG